MPVLGMTFRQLRRLAMSAAMAAAIFLAPSVPLAGAEDDFCDSDPPILVRTPEGNPVLVNNFVSIPRRYKHAAHNMEITGSSERAGHGRSKITVKVTVPGERGSFNYRLTSKVQRFEVSNQGSSSAGNAIILELFVPLP